MAIEIELKARCRDREALRRRLAGAGAELVEPRTLEDNILLDRGDGSLAAGGRLVRVRLLPGGGAMLCWKGEGSIEAGIKSREEIETACADGQAVLAILARIGLRPSLRYQKYRETWQLGPVQVMLDETPAGDFLEIEGEPGDVRAAEGQLAIAPSDRVDESYPRMFARLLAAAGEGSRELLFER